MRRFRFVLEKVLDFRRRQLEAAEARLNESRLRKELSLQKAVSIQEEFGRLSEEATQKQVTTGAELRAREDYLHLLNDERRLQLEQEEKWEQVRQKQVRDLIEVRRKVKLLEMLRAKKLDSYLRAADRESESLAADLHLANWGRERRR